MYSGSEGGPTTQVCVEIDTLGLVTAVQTTVSLVATDNTASEYNKKNTNTLS